MIGDHEGADISIIGGGISGLAAAWELSSDPSLEITVHEASASLGGKISTSKVAGIDVDRGADAFLQRVPDGVRLCEEVGLNDLRHPANQSALVWVDGSLRRLPNGLVLGVPVDFDALEASEILTPWGLARARTEPTLEEGVLVGDASIGAYISRRYGAEVVNRIVGPLLGGINAGDIHDMSLDAVAPQLADVAHRHQTMTEGLAAQLETRPANSAPVFAAPQHGVAQLIQRLEEVLRERGVRFILNEPVTSIDPTRATIITTPAHVTAELLGPIDDVASRLLADISYASVVFVTIAYRRSDLPSSVFELDASGFLLPRDCGFSITAASMLSTKWHHLDGDTFIMRASLGHSGDHQSIDISDAEVTQRIRADFNAILGITADPIDVRIVRYPNAFPQYTPGHLERTHQLEASLLRSAPKLAVCGMAHRGVGIPACIREARRSAASLRDRLADSNQP